MSTIEEERREGDRVNPREEQGDHTRIDVYSSAESGYHHHETIKVYDDGDVDYRVQTNKDHA